jgi:putative thiamine transport system permease protein
VTWAGGERIVARAGLRWVEGGARSGAVGALCAAAAAALAVLLALALLAVAGMALWSFAGQWRFPDALPVAWAPGNWALRVASLAVPAANTVVVGVAATAIALTLAIACLESESRAQRSPGRTALWLLYVPLLVPQIAFLFGVQVLLVRMRIDGTIAAVVWAHLVFVVPYVFLSLADPWRELDPRYARTAASLGVGPSRVLFTVKLPILLRPVLIAAAVGFAVSVALYLPTLFAGNGRVATLTTDAVTLASGADRRVVGAYALLQAALPMLGYFAATLARRR